MTAIRFRDVALSEWTKLRSLRSTAWSFLVLAGLSIGVSVLVTSLFTANWDHLGGDDRRDMVRDPIGLILQPGILWGQIALCVLGVLLFAGEYSTGMIRASMLAVPRRTPVLAARAAVFAAVTFVVAEVVAFVCFFAGQAIISRHVAISLTDPGVLRAIVGTGLYLPVIGLLALSVGAIVRHAAGAITLIIAMILVLPTVANVLPDSVNDYVSAYLPGGMAGSMITSSGNVPGAVVSPWQGFGVACGWTALALLLAAVSLRRRDV